MQQRYSLLLACMLLGMQASIVQAQMAGTSIFLQGQYVEVGINDCGVYGSDEPTPVGPYGEYHGINYNGLGYIADHEKDGWDVATGADQPVFCGDYFTPGSPEEGWAIQYGDSVYENHATYCQGYFGGGWYYDTLPNMPGANTVYEDTLGVKTGIWEGILLEDGLDLSIKQITKLQDTALYFTSSIEITNNGATDLTDLYYIRNVDPDQDLDNCGTFMTYNTIVSNTPASDTVMITAVGGACGCYFGTIAVDPRARVSYGNFYLSPNKPSEAYEGTDPYSIEGAIECDCAVQITYKFDLAAGETTTLSYARLFDGSVEEEAIGTLINLTTPVIIADGTELSSESGITLCEGQSTTLDIEGPAGFTWTWEPADFLDASTGTHVVSTPTSDITYLVTGTNGSETMSTSVIISVSETMELSMESVPSLEGTATGSASVTVSEGGIAPYTYEWMSGETTSTIDGLVPGAYIVWVTDAAGCEATQAVTVETANSIAGLEAAEAFQVYPNPATASFQIELHPYMTGVITVEVSTTSGQVVWTQQANSNSILNVDSSTWSNGVYYVRVSNTQASYVNTVVIDK